MNDRQFDRLFDAAFEAAELPVHDGLKVDHRPSWERLRKKLRVKSRRSRARSGLSRLAILAATLILGAIIFGNDQTAKAIEPLYASLKEYPSGIIGFLFGREDDDKSSKAVTSAPPDYLEGLSYEKIGESTIEAASLSEAQAAKLLSFRAPSLEYLPKGFSFDVASLYFEDGREKADRAIYAFKSTNGDYLTLVAQRGKPNNGLGLKKTGEGIESKMIRVKDVQAILTQSTTFDTASLETIINDIYYSFSGKFSEEELIRIVEGLK